MNDNIKDLIRYVSTNDIVKAKKMSIQILTENASKKDESFCRCTLNKMKNEPMFMELPANISTFCTMEDMTECFIEKRYYLTEQENIIFKSIITADKAGERLAQKRIRYLNSTLLFGDSGTGKTTFGRYISYRLGIPFLYLNFSYLIDSLLGGTGKNIQRVFDYAKNQRCVFMLDELDAIGVQRGSGNESGEISRIVISLMQSLDMLGNNVILIAATNRYDIIDEALKRRFTRHHEIKELTQEESLKFARNYLTDCGYPIGDYEAAVIIGKEHKQSEIEKKVIQYIIRYELNGSDNLEV